VSKKLTILIYAIEMLWCIWLISTTTEQMQKNPVWWTISSFWISIGLLIFWAIYAYRTIRPRKPKELNYELEEDAEGAFWLTANGQTKSGPYTYRHEAYDQIIKDIQEEMRK
jgi:hypothetical protein